MNIKDRIQNIKTLLKYTDEVILCDDITTNFFSKFFNGDERFEHFSSERKIFPKIKLAKYVLTRDENNKIIDVYPIQISYCYDWDRDGEDWISYYFDEEIVRNNWMFNDSKDLIKFEEIPDYIWEIIQNSAYKEAVKTIDNELKSARSSIIYWEKRKEEFNKQILNT